MAESLSEGAFSPWRLLSVGGSLRFMIADNSVLGGPRVACSRRIPVRPSADALWCALVQAPLCRHTAVAQARVWEQPSCCKLGRRAQAHGGAGERVASRVPGG